MMTRRHRKYSIIALLMLVYVGQSLAVVAMPCQWMHEGASGTPAVAQTAHSMTGMHHGMGSMAHVGQGANHTHTKTNNSTDSHDCCQSKAHCTAASSALLALNSDLSLGVMTLDHSIADHYFAAAPHALVAALLRPPNFR